MTWETWSTLAAAFLLEKLGDWMTVNGHGGTNGEQQR